MAGRQPEGRGRVSNGAAQHFGKQMKKAREAHGWSLLELGRRTGVNAAHLGRIESGKRPPTREVAIACDHIFPERDGWFTDWYDDSGQWMPPGFRVWAEHEDQAKHVHVWTPGIIHGLAQAEVYMREVLAMERGATEEQIATRLQSRLDRQKRVLGHDAAVVLLVDHAALYRLVGSPAVMAEQMRHLLHLASLPRVTLQLVPQIGHQATGSELIIADDAAYVEHLTAGAVHTSGEVFTRLEMIMDTLRSEAYRASESQRIILEAEERWNAK